MNYIRFCEEEKKIELTFIDFFCGIGTIRMGMERAGHKCVYSVEWDKHKRKIYLIIFGGEPEGADICAVNARELPRADVWTFGAPCQDFSIAGTRSGLEGDRSSLIREVFRLVRETEEEYRPKYLLYENVKGMLSSNKGFDYLEILSEMESLGYDIEWQLLNSKNFGVPQNRERVFTIGHLRGQSTRKVFPISGNGGETTAELQELTQGLADTFRVYHQDGLARTLKAEAGGCGAKTGLYAVVVNHGKLQEKKIANCIDANYHNGLDNRGQRTGVAISIDLKSIASSTRGGMYKEEYVGALDVDCRVGVTKGYKIRKLTPKECWRLQGIPDEITDKVIQAGISDTQMYHAAGDACTVNVIFEIAKKLT